MVSISFTRAHACAQADFRQSSKLRSTWNTQSLVGARSSIEGSMVFV